LGTPGPLIAADLEHAARCAVALAAGAPPPLPRDPADAETVAREIVDAAAPQQRAVCGLFAGGTLAQEAASAMARALGGRLHDAGGTRSGEVLSLEARGGAVGVRHSVLDLGDDAYTRGRPHPLIDPRLRNEELVAQAGSGAVGLFILDVILGTGSHDDPAEALAPALAAARAATEAAGGTFQVIASLCGTEDDSQGYQRQRAALEAQGVRVAASSSAAAAVAARVAALLANEEVAR
jgi:FdrA protein